MLTETQSAYIAGIIDGEGCFIISPDMRSGVLRGYAVMLEISNCDFALLEAIKEWLGAGFIRPKPRDLARHRPNFVLRITGDTLRELLINVRPFLIIKKRQSDLVAKTLELNQRKGKTKTAFFSSERIAQIAPLHAEIRRLNHRGARIDNYVA